MKVIVFLAVLGLALAASDHTRAPCPEEAKTAMKTAFDQCRESMTTPLPSATVEAATDSDSESSEEHGPPRAVKRYFAECVSAKIQDEASIIPIITECKTKFDNGEITQAKKEKCIMNKMRKSCWSGRPRRPFSTTASA